jgi:predicted DNA-binding transcriptional regulator YafY
MDKNQMLRHKIINNCLRNREQQYKWSDLAMECTDALTDKALLKKETLSKKTIHNDLNYIRNNFDVEIVEEKRGRYNYYTYADAGMSIDKQPLAPDELEKFKQAIATLSSISGRNEFDYIADILPRLETSLDIDIDTKPVISYQSNDDLRNFHLVPDIFNHIRNKDVLKIIYEDFKGDVYHYTFHPYFLKQHNNRWFLFGLDEQVRKENGYFPLNIPIDRIERMEVLEEDYIENEEIDFDGYFDNILGVTKFSDREEVTIIFRVDRSFANYIKTKPIHPYQKLLKLKDDNYYHSSVKLIPNNELYNTILSFGEKVEILSPESVRKELADKIKKMNNLYK